MFQRDKCKATLDSEKVFLFNAMEPSSKKRKLSAEWFQEALQNAQVDDNTKTAVLDAVVQLSEDTMLQASLPHWDFLLQDIVRDQAARRALIITLDTRIHQRSPQTPVPRLLTLAPPPLVSSLFP